MNKLFLCTLALFSIAFAEGNADLAKVDKEISSIKSSLSKSKTQQEQLTNALKMSEKEIGKLSKKMSTTAANISSQKTQLSKLQTQLKIQQEQLHAKQMILAQQIKANYPLSRQGQWGLYFNGQPTNDIDRYLAYYQTLNAAQVNTIKSLQDTINTLISTANKIQTNTKTLSTLYTTQKQQQDTIKKQQANREKVLKEIDSTIKSSSKQLEQLNTNKKNLTTVVNKVATATGSQKFYNLKRQLDWPVKGKLLEFYGQKLKSGLISEGDLIAADSGTQVHAIHSGKVVFADWLRGYGLLIILDHGDGYMSLYGRNHSLYKATGDHVNTGDVIATVGKSGGYTTSALYLELRHNGKNINPELWLKKR